MSRYGLIAYGSSLDQIGPLAKNVEDCATILEIISQYDKKDSTSVNRDDNDFTSALVDDVKGLKIGLPRDYFTEGLEPEIKEAVYGVAETLKARELLLRSLILEWLSMLFLLTISLHRRRQVLTLRDSTV